MVNPLYTDVAGIKLRNPTMLASGILGITGDLMLKVEEAGAGAVVSKSVSLEGRIGYLNPSVIQVKCGLLNAVGLSNPGIEEFREEVKRAKEGEVPVIVSVFGYTTEEYLKVAVKAEEAGADGVELNVSCPHVEATGSQIGQNPRLLKEVVKMVKGGIGVPVFVKLTPNVSDITEIAEAAVDGGADALTAINTVKAMAIDIETAHPILANKVGGLSGPAIKPVAVRCVYEITREVSIPVVGCGGVVDWRDAVEFLLAGASAVQIGSAIMRRDLRVFASISEGLETYLKSKGYRKVEDIVGLSHRY